MEDQSISRILSDDEYDSLCDLNIHMENIYVLLKDKESHTVSNARNILNIILDTRLVSLAILEHLKEYA